jgi:2-hydroxychromene-2-carboxylate isomerase
VTIRWVPFTTVQALTGATQRPFVEGASKYRYMWRDIERRAALQELPIRVPLPYPAVDTVQANRVALVGLREGWGREYIRAAYRRWFQYGDGNGGEPNLKAALAECGQDYQRVTEIAAGEETRREIELATTEARELGVFGSPTFVIGTELFWGDDHLEDAINWAKVGRLAVRERYR